MLNIERNGNGAFQADGNSITISEAVSIEWVGIQGGTVKVEPLSLDGCEMLKITTPKMARWVRLHMGSVVHSLGALGSHFVLMIRSGAAESSVKVFPVKTSLRNGRRLEFTAAPGRRLRLAAEKWYDISGVVVFGDPEIGFSSDLVMDLPVNAEILLADVSLEKFAVAPSKDKAEGLSQDGACLLSPFEAAVVSGDLAGRIGRPKVYACTAGFEGGRLSGKVLTSAKTIYLKGSATPIPREIPLDHAANFDGFLFGAGGFEQELDSDLVGTDAMVLALDDKAEHYFWRGATSGKHTMSPPQKSPVPRDRQDQVILLWAPISTAGLTVQLEQVTAILDKNKFDYKISYHMKPTVRHPLMKHWVDPRDIEQPKMVIYFERFVEFDRGFDGAFKIFYMNLDWLSGKTLALAKTHAKIVLCPTPYRLKELGETFSNSQVVYLPWPARFQPRRSNAKADPGDPIRVLYVGNDYDDVSRKHPMQVVEAIEQLQRDDIVIDLKFRLPLPQDVRARLADNPRVGTVIDWSTNHSVVEEMYRVADINLIPNACEGNGLSILESWASGTVPAVLNGHPMIDVTSDENSYRIACTQDGTQEYAPYYRTTAADILDFLNSLRRDDVMEKKATVSAIAKELIDRQQRLEKTLVSCVLLSGIRTKGLRERVEKAHLPSKKYKDWQPRSGQRIKDLMFSDEGQHDLLRSPKLIDVLLTTSRRPWCLRESLRQLALAIRQSPYKHRLMIAVDTMDPETMGIINEHFSEIDQVLWTREQHGLPYTWNSLKGLLRNTIRRTETRPDYVCYIQDDCYIRDPANYFSAMVGIASDAMAGYLGFVSGFYTEVHPGFADFEWKGYKVIASDSIDGKNFMATPEVLESTGDLTWWFSDGMRRGNPGPIRGSHFDLWQWKESPNSLLKQSRVTLTLPELCSHIAERADQSTWNNDTSDEAVKKRVDEARVYQTRTYKT